MVTGPSALAFLWLNKHKKLQDEEEMMGIIIWVMEWFGERKILKDRPCKIMSTNERMRLALKKTPEIPYPRFTQQRKPHLEIVKKKSI